MFDIDLTTKDDGWKSLDCSFLSESSLKKEWLKPEEDIAWRDL